MITRLSAWWARGPSPRGMITVLMIGLAALAVRWAVLAPMFSHQMGFLPFDLQPGINRGMLVIQLGAARGRPLAPLYGAFVTADIPVSLVLAFVTVVFWRWLHLRAPNSVYAFLTSGGIMLLPPAVAALEMLEHRAVFSLLHQRGSETFADAVNFAVAAHAVSSAVADVCNGLSLIFIVVTAGLRFMRRRSAGGDSVQS